MSSDQAENPQTEESPQVAGKENGPNSENAAEPTTPSTPPPSVPLGPKTEMEEFLPGKIWTKLYYVRYAGATFSAKTTVVKLNNGKLWVHSPGGPLDDDFKEGIEKIGGEVGYLIAPGNFHHTRVPEWQLAYPNAKTFICAGLDRKRKDLNYDGILSDTPEEDWKDELLQMDIQGRMMCEVLFFHKASETLIVTDMVEFITDEAAKKDGTGQGWGAWFWVNVFRMKNRALMAPEYRVMGFSDKNAVKAKLLQVIEEWQPEKVILAHGENMNQGKDSIKAILRQCWSAVIGKPPGGANNNQNQAESPPEEPKQEPAADNTESESKPKAEQEA